MVHLNFIAKILTVLEKTYCIENLYIIVKQHFFLFPLVLRTD